jgi:hypothetical protein
LRRIRSDREVAVVPDGDRLWQMAAVVIMK